MRDPNWFSLGSGGAHPTGEVYTSWSSSETRRVELRDEPFRRKTRTTLPWVVGARGESYCPKGRVTRRGRARDSSHPHTSPHRFVHTHRSTRTHNARCRNGVGTGADVTETTYFPPTPYARGTGRPPLDPESLLDNPAPLLPSQTKRTKTLHKTPSTQHGDFGNDHRRPTRGRTSPSPFRSPVRPRPCVPESETDESRRGPSS